MREPIENEYFNWLCAKVLERGTRSYYTLLGILHKTEFVWVESADINRCEDGIELREDFLRETRQQADSLWMNEPCSIFEMFISFAKRCSFQTDMPVREWFWIFMTNLYLDQYRQVSDSDISLIDKTLYNFVWRLYDSNGHGGMFPFDRTPNDQRKIEIWYQWCEWVDNQGLL